MADTVVDKNQAVIDFLITCPKIRNSPLYFNFIEATDDSKQIVTLANDKALNHSYIDGSVLKQYTFTIVDYKSVAYQAVVKMTGYPNENVEEMMDSQAIIDWVTQQNRLKNYPNFGPKCEIEEMEAATDNPTLNGVDTSVNPSLAKYSISIKITYLDTTDVIWGN